MVSILFFYVILWKRHEKKEVIMAFDLDNILENYMETNEENNLITKQISEIDCAFIAMCWKKE